MSRAPAIRAGEPAPDFTAPERAGGMLSLGDFRGRRAVVLFFYPKNHTSVCTAEACCFRDHFEDFQRAGAEVIGVSGDPLASHEKFAANHRLPFHLLSDSDGSLRRLYGVPKTLGLIPGRVTFVIDREGIVRHVFSALFATDKHVREALDALARIHAASGD